jgi:predicted transcriptional regulator
MARPASKNPTDLELEILKILWDTGPQSVRHVRDALAPRGRDLAYTSVMTIMTIMTTKKYLKRTKTPAGFIYAPLQSRQSTTAGMLKDLVRRAFGGSPAAAMLNLLSTEDLKAEDLKALRAEIDKRQGSKK